MFLCLIIHDYILVPELSTKTKTIRSFPLLIYIYIYIYIRMSTGRMCFCVRGAILFRDSLESVTKRLLRSYQWITYFKMTVIRKTRLLQMGVIYLYLHCTTLSVRSKLFSQEIHLRPLQVSPREKPEVHWGEKYSYTDYSVWQNQDRRHIC